MFHLTVLMLKLRNEDRLKLALEVMERVSTRVIAALEGRPVSVRLKGLDCMKGSLDKARVIYVPIEEVGGGGRLLRACQVIINAFIMEGLVMEKDMQHKLKLHATLMNARHRTINHVTRNLDNRESFDARGILISMDQKNGEIIMYVKLTFPKGSCLMTVAITIAAFQFLFLDYDDRQVNDALSLNGD